MNKKKDIIINPIWLVLFFAFTAVIVYVFSIPEQPTACIIGFCFIIISFLNPLNGIYFILLCTPFFLGDSKCPYFLMLEFFVYVTIAAAVIHKIYMQKRKWIFPFKVPILLYLLVCLVSLPINLKELFLELRCWPVMHSLIALVTSYEGFNIYYLRVLLNIVSGIILYIITVNFVDENKRITDFFMPALILSTIVIIFGFLFFFDMIPHAKFYLSLSLIGKTSGMTALAYNPTYFAEFLILMFPILFYFLRQRGIKPIYFLLLVVYASALTIANQRAPFIVLFLQIIFLFLVYLLFGKGTKRLFYISASSLLVTIFLTDYLVFNFLGIDRLMKVWEYHPERLQIISIAWQMAKRFPLLGIGLGKFHYFFPEYCTPAGLSWDILKVGYIRSEAHNIYMHILAEQGFLGLASFLFLIICFFYSILKSLKKLNEIDFNIIVTLTASLFGWLVFGMTQHMFYIRSMQTFFWILLGFLAVMLRPYVKQNKIPKKIVYGMIIFFLIVLAYRINEVRSYPINPGYTAGFYDWEYLPDNRKVRWMGKKAAMKLSVQGDVLTLNAAALIPGLDERPQELEISTDQGYKREVTFRNNNWIEVKIPVNKKQAENIWIWFRCSYAIIPKKLGINNDQRTLGVLLEEEKWETM